MDRERKARLVTCQRRRGAGRVLTPVAAAILAAVVLAGCSSGQAGETGTDPPPSSTLDLDGSAPVPNPTTSSSPAATTPAGDDLEPAEDSGQAPTVYAVIAEEESRRLAVIDASVPCTGCELALVATFDLPERPHNLAGAGSVVYATHPAAGAVSRVDVATGEVQTAPVGIQPHDIKYSSRADALFVADEAGGALLTLDPATLEVEAVVDLPGEPHDLAVDGEGVWLTLTGRDELARIEDGEVELFPTGGSPHDLIVAGDGRIWFSNWGSDALSIFEAMGGKTIDAPAGVAEPHHFAIDAEGVMWVSDNGGASIVGFTDRGLVSVEVGPVPHHLVAVDGLLVVAVSGSGEAVLVRDGEVVARAVLSPGLHGAAVVETDQPLGGSGRRDPARAG